MQVLVDFYAGFDFGIKKGAIRELNPGPPAPKAGIIPLDQSPLVLSLAPCVLSAKHLHLTK